MTAADQVIHEPHRRERFRRIGLSFIASVLARGLGMVITIITTPLTLHYLGTERYAMWVTLSSIGALLAFADLGIGNGLINSIAAANGKEDRVGAQRYVSNAFLMLTALALLIGMVFALLYSVVPWERIFNVTSPLARAEAGPVIAVFVACILINLPLGVIQKTLMGYQEAYIDNLWSMAGKIAGLVGIFLAVRLDAGLVGLVVALFAIPLIPLALSGVQLFFVRRPWLKPTLRSASPQIIQSLMKLGWLFFVLQAASTFAYSIDNLVITQVISPEAVTHYAIPAQLFKLSSAFIALLSLPLWPAYGEAIARHDLKWVRQTFRYSLLLNFFSSALISLILIVAAQQIIHLWIGQDNIALDPMLLIGLAIWTILYNVSYALAMLFNAAQIVRFQVIWASVMALTNLALSVLLTRQFGAIGVVLGSIISYLICIFPPYFWRVPRVFAALESKQEGY